MVPEVEETDKWAIRSGREAARTSQEGRIDERTEMILMTNSLVSRMLAQVSVSREVGVISQTEHLTTCEGKEATYLSPRTRSD
jgi:hypothetical protein